MKKHEIMNTVIKERKKQDKMLKRRIREAKFRRKINEKWEGVERGLRYRRAVVREGCDSVTAMIHEECFDGIFLQLNERSSSKSYKEQKRLLRRIVEKRQAQLVHRRIGRTDDRFYNHMKCHNVSKSVDDLRRIQFCA